MWWSRRRLVASLAALPLVAAGCGFTPLYDEGSPAAGMGGRVEVGVIDGVAGLAMRERLVSRLGPADQPTHRLSVSLAYDTTGVALTTESVTTRFDVIGRAEFALVPIGGGPAAASGRVRAVTGVSAPDLPAATAFAVESAERDAQRRLAIMLADQILMRLALSAAEWAP